MSPQAPFIAPGRDEAFRIPRPRESGLTYYTIPGVVNVGGTSTTTTANATDYYGPFVIQSPIMVDRLAFEITTAQATKNARVGLYSADEDWQARGAPLADSGDISVGTTGVKTYTPGTAIYLPRGAYLTVYASDSTTAAVRSYLSDPPGMVIDQNLGTTFHVQTLTGIRAYGAFPTPGSAWVQGLLSGTGTAYHVVLRVLKP